MRQHKRVTAILFCDLVESTELGCRLEAEAVNEILNDYRAQVTSIISSFGGQLARARGDEILAYFGYPSAQEDDASRAVRAANSIIEGLISTPAETLRVRIGISLGEVIIVEAQNSFDDRPSVVGHAANIAACIQVLAAPDTMIVSEAVVQACSSGLKFKDLGLFSFKGGENERLYLFVGETLRNPLRHLSLIGRDAEVARLKNLWENAKRGAGTSVLVSGEPGIGKSRLAAELQRIAQAEGAFVLRLQSARHRMHSDLHPLHELLRQAARMQSGDPPLVRRRKLERYFALFWKSPAPAPLMECLSELGAEDKAPVELTSSLQKRERQLTTLVAGIAQLSRDVPILIIHEDAQWSDPASEEWLAKLAEEAIGQRLLLVVTARRDYAPKWVRDPQVQLLVPRRMDRATSQRILERVQGWDKLPPDEQADIIDRAEGVPFFLEELAKDAASHVGRSNATSHLPISLNAVLLSRLDAAPSAKRVAQMAAILGRSFDHDLAATVWGSNGPEFAAEIEALMTAEVLLPRPVQSGARYEFRHALLQEAASASLLREERMFIHARVVDALSAAAPETLDEHPELIAYHCDCAGRHDLATRYWLRAGQRSARRGAVTTAANSFRMGLASAQNGSVHPNHERVRFELLLGLGSAVMAESGYTSKEAFETFEAARSLKAHARDRREELQVWMGLFNVHFGRGDLRRALDVATHAHGCLLPDYGGYPVLMGQAYCYMGNYEEAHRQLERALEAYNPSVDQDLGLFCRADVVATSFLAKVEFAFGNLRRSSDLTEKALSLARVQGHPIAIAIALLGRLFLLTDSRRFDEAEKAFDEAQTHASSNHLSNYALWVRFIGAALSLRHDANAAISKMQDAITAMDEAGTLMFRPAQLALLGGAFVRMGRWAEALQAIEQGIAVAYRTEARDALPALHRMRAHLVAKDNPVQGGQLLQTAMDEARSQGAAMEELRSAIAIARTLKVMGRKDEAARLLSKVYARLPQDYPHPDLSAAANLLQELA